MVNIQLTWKQKVDKIKENASEQLRVSITSGCPLSSASSSINIAIVVAVVVAVVAVAVALCVNVYALKWYTFHSLRFTVYGLPSRKIKIWRKEKKLKHNKK